MFIIKLLSQHVSGIVMPIIRRTRVCIAAYGVLVVMVVVVSSWDASFVHCDSYCLNPRTWVLKASILNHS